MASTHITKKKINKSTLILSFILLLILTFFGFLIYPNIYWPNQTKVISFSNPSAYYPYAIVDGDYKNIQIKVIAETGEEITYYPDPKFDTAVDGSDVPEGVIYSDNEHYDNNEARKLYKKFKVEITNKSNKIQFINYEVGTYASTWTTKKFKRIYF